MKKYAFIAVFVALFAGVAVFLNLTERTAPFSEKPPLAIGPVLETDMPVGSEDCTARGAPSFYMFLGWPFPSIDPQAACETTRALYPVGIVLNTIVAGLITLGIALLIKAERRKQDEEPERPPISDEA